MINSFSIDLEEWFCSHNLTKAINYNDWDSLESRVEVNTYFLLELLGSHKIKATFFVLGWIADRYPDLILEINRQGHEVASHGYSHRLLHQLSSDQFEDELQKSVDVLGNLIGKQPEGFRAPAFSWQNDQPWQEDLLLKYGFAYDSSVFPVSFHPDYGEADSPLAPYLHTSGLLEVPMSVVQLGSMNIPCSGGGYFRQLPYVIFKSLIKRLHSQGRGLNFYLHPWELDEDTPKVNLSLSKKWRHYNGLSSTKSKLNQLLSDYEFTSIEQSIEHSYVATSL